VLFTGASEFANTWNGPRVQGWLALRRLGLPYDIGVGPRAREPHTIRGCAATDPPEKTAGTGFPRKKEIVSIKELSPENSPRLKGLLYPDDELLVPPSAVSPTLFHGTGEIYFILFACSSLENCRRILKIK